MLYRVSLFLLKVIALSALWLSTSLANNKAISNDKATTKSIIDIDRGTGSTEFDAIGKPGFIKIHGKGSAPHGTLLLEGSTASGNLTFDLDSLDTGIKMRNEHMKVKYLETKKFPQAKLTLNQVELTKDFDIKNCSATEAPFQGVLNIRGIEKPIKGQSKIECALDNIKIKAGFNFTIDDFNIAVPNFAGVNMAKDVKVSVTIQAPTVAVSK